MSSTQNQDQTPYPSRTVVQILRSFWCAHHDTVTHARAAGMPAHLECRTCAWREPVPPALPQGTRTWDSSRDEARYQAEKRRRAAAEQQRLLAQVRLAGPLEGKTRTRARRANVVALRPAVGE
jgi:hypothetical protein